MKSLIALIAATALGATAFAAGAADAPAPTEKPAAVKKVSNKHVDKTVKKAAAKKGEAGSEAMTK